MKIIAVISIVLISSVNGCNQYDSILCQEYIETINLENDTSIVDNVLYVNDISTCSKVFLSTKVLSKIFIIPNSPVAKNCILLTKS